MPAHTTRLVVASALLFSSPLVLACAGGDSSVDATDEVEIGSSEDAVTEDGPDGATVYGVASRGCTTSIVAPLATQLVRELECMHPGTMGDIGGSADIRLEPEAFPFLQKPAAVALARAAQAAGGITINSSLRTLPQQYLLRRWAAGGRCDIAKAASPGASKHESGLAVDVDDYAAKRRALEKNGFVWFGAGDAVHFTFKGGDSTLTGEGVKAFQRLWNANHPGDRITESGRYDVKTEAKLKVSPVRGFRIGASCQH